MQTSEHCPLCTKRWTYCHCGDWAVRVAFGQEYVNADWEAQLASNVRPGRYVTARGAKGRPAGWKQSRSNGPVTTRRHVPVGTKVASR